MGLQIVAYRKLSKLGEEHPEADDSLRVHSNSDFPGRAAGLEPGAFYLYAEVEIVFRLSYGGYNRWREDLAVLAGYPPDSEGRCVTAAWVGLVKPDAPFCELINFSDCEGTIGPVVAAKLLRDFIAFDERAAAMIDPWFYKGYCGLRRGLELAADNGALDFN